MVGGKKNKINELINLKKKKEKKKRAKQKHKPMKYQVDQEPPFPSKVQ